MYVGWGWASEGHDVTVLDERGAIVTRWALEHDEAGLATTLARLAGLGDPSGLPVAIETSSGLVGRAPARGRPSGRAHPSQRAPCQPAPLGCGRGQVRSRRQLSAGRLPAHRGPSPPTVATARRGHGAAAGPRVPARRPRGGQSRGHEPAGQHARGALARGGRRLLPARLGHRARFPRALPDTHACRAPGRASDGGLPAPLGLQRTPQRRRGARAAAGRTLAGRWARPRCAGRLRLGPGPARAHVAADHPRSRAGHRGGPARAPDDGGARLAAPHRPGQPGPGHRRGGSHHRAHRWPGCGRRRDRGRAGDEGLGQEPRRRLPLGGQRALLAMPSRPSPTTVVMPRPGRLGSIARPVPGASDTPGAIRVLMRAPSRCTWRSGGRQARGRTNVRKAVRM